MVAKLCVAVPTIRDDELSAANDEDTVPGTETQVGNTHRKKKRSYHNLKPWLRNRGPHGQRSQRIH